MKMSRQHSSGEHSLGGHCLLTWMALTLMMESGLSLKFANKKEQGESPGCPGCCSSAEDKAVHRTGGGRSASAAPASGGRAVSAVSSAPSPAGGARRADSAVSSAVAAGGSGGSGGGGGGSTSLGGGRAVVAAAGAGGVVAAPFSKGNAALTRGSLDEVHTSDGSLLQLAAYQGPLSRYAIHQEHSPTYDNVGGVGLPRSRSPLLGSDEKPLGSFVIRDSDLWNAIEKDFKAGNKHCNRGRYKAGDGTDYGLFIYSIEKVADPVMEKNYEQMRSRMLGATENADAALLVQDSLADVMVPPPYTEAVAAWMEQAADGPHVSLAKSAGEMFVFHGTTEQAALLIATSGPIAARGKFGTAFYTTDQAIKAIQYANLINYEGDSGNTIRTPGYTLMIQALLGRKPREYVGVSVRANSKELLEQDGTPNALVVNGVGEKQVAEYNEHREILLAHTEGTVLPKFLVRFQDQKYTGDLAKKELDILLRKHETAESEEEKEEWVREKTDILKKNPAAVCSIADRVEEIGRSALQPESLWDIVLKGVLPSGEGADLSVTSRALQCCVFRMLPQGLLRDAFNTGMLMASSTAKSASKCFVQRGSIPEDIPVQIVLESVGVWQIMGSDPVFVENALKQDAFFLERFLARYPKDLSEVSAKWCADDAPLLRRVFLLAAGNEANVATLPALSESSWGDIAATLPSHHLEETKKEELVEILRNIPQCWQGVLEDSLKGRATATEEVSPEESSLTRQKPGVDILTHLIKAARDRFCEAIHTHGEAWAMLSRERNAVAAKECTEDEQKMAVKINAENLKFVKLSLRNDRDTVLEAVQKDGDLLKYAGDGLISDTGFLREAIEQKSTRGGDEKLITLLSIRGEVVLVGKVIWNNKDLMRSILKSAEYSEKWKFQALERALKYAQLHDTSSPSRDDEALMRHVIERMTDDSWKLAIFRYAGAGLKRNEEFVRWVMQSTALYRERDSIFMLAGDGLKGNADFVSWAIQSMTDKDGKCRTFNGAGKEGKVDFVSWAMQSVQSRDGVDDGQSVQSHDDEVDPRVKILESASPELRSNASFMLKCISDDDAPVDRSEFSNPDAVYKLPVFDLALASETALLREDEAFILAVMEMMTREQSKFEVLEKAGDGLKAKAEFLSKANESVKAGSIKWKLQELAGSAREIVLNSLFNGE
ncbi:unnamed protein product [Amoebophrya sp. A25]|nr:unnamed protein product [Amoebophrya sp. A25]|eukprot:GSA25T00012955001.1